MASVEPRRFTVEEYERMGEAGIFGPGERVELIEGQVVPMTPINPPHAGTSDALLRVLIRALGDRAHVRVGNPLVLNAFSEPQPDLAVVRARADDYRRSHPRPEDVYLLIEVAHSSARLDRGVKAPLYARTGIAEYWLVDVGKRIVEVHRSPGGAGYGSVDVRRAGDGVSPEAFPDIVLSVSDILGTG